MSSTQASGDLAQRVARVLGRPAVRLEELAPGTSRGAVRVLSEAGEPIAFLRIDLGIDTAVAAGKNLATEMALVRRAHELGFPVPRVFAVIDNPQVGVMELAAGTARPDPAEAERVGPEFMGHIARLHTISPAEFGLPAAPTVNAAIGEDLAGWIADAEGRGVMRLPLVRLAARILRHTLPPSDAPPAMLHGDVGAGNFMVHDGKVSAILDWELAHAGDPHEDLAWLWTRGAHTPFGDPRQRLAEYEAAAGRALDPARLAWHVAFVTFKSVLGLQRRMHAPGEDAGLFVILIAVITYEALLCATLARLLDTDLDLLAEAPVTVRNEAVRMAELLPVHAPPASREGELLQEYLRTEAAHRDWNAARLAEDAQVLLGLHPDALGAAVDAASPDRFPSLLQVLGRAAGRRCKALPNAERRVRRGLAILFPNEARS